MQYRILGRTGARVSELGFGGASAGNKNYLKEWDPFDEKNIQSVEDSLRRAVELGVNYFDTAPKYGSEEIYGRALKPFRDRVFVATKAWARDADGIVESIEESLGRLQMDYVDLVQFHGDWYTDELIEQILKPNGALAGLQAAQKKGLTRFVGFSAEGLTPQLYQLIHTGEFDVMQLQYNVMFQGSYDAGKENGAMFDAEAQRMGIVDMRPFTGGIFPRWIKTAYPGIEELIDFPKLMGSLLSFALSNPLVDVALVGMRTIDRAEQNCAIVDDLSNRVDILELGGRFWRKPEGEDEFRWMPTSGRAREDNTQDNY